jgi:undecaprenyl-diphosphatase
VNLILKSAFLGFVQGLTEFLPVSSSGHLVIIEKLFGWKDLGLAFNVAVHMGTLLALIAFFRREWIEVIKGFFRSLRVRPSRWDADGRLAWMLVLATIPAVIVGALLSDQIERNLQTLFWVATFLVAGSLVMMAAELWGKKARDFGALRAGDAVLVGFAQVLALAPGVSRSGITISAGMFSGLNREAAARFAFMMAAPIIGGAGLWEAIKLVRHGLGTGTPGAFAAGFVTSALAGFFVVKYFLRYLRHGSLTPFVIYRLVVAAGVYIYLIVA